MTSRFSKVNKKNSSASKAAFNKHNVFEVATTLTESKYIANDFADAQRYAYRAKVNLIGDCLVKPYEPIYLDGLPDGMDGYWTVLSVTHIFGGVPAKYMMQLEVGTDILGQTNPEAYKAVPVRDISGELSGQAISPTQSKLQDYSFSVNNSTLEPDYGITAPSSAVSKPYNDLGEDAAPDFSIIKRPVTWAAYGKTGVIR